MPWDSDGGLKYAQAALAAYDVPASAELTLMRLSENATFLVTAEKPLGVLRIYRPNYQTDSAKRSELIWIEQLRAMDTVSTPAVIRTKTGEALHRVSIDGCDRDCVMFEHVAARELSEEDVEAYVSLGEIAARLHLQVLGWDRPEGFERWVWGLEEIVGPHAYWGDWRRGPALDAEGLALLEEAERKIRARLTDYPFQDDNSGLIHGDLRMANILSADDGRLWVIDFDDCGYSWFLWDLCTTTSFIEHTPGVDDIVEALLDGYTSVRSLSARDLAVFTDLVFMRRLQVLAWLGSHPESDVARELGESYSVATLDLARKYLDGTFLPRLPALAEHYASRKTSAKG